MFDETIEALDRFRELGRRLIMVTGRELDEFLDVCNCVDRFEIVVAENGAACTRRQRAKPTDYEPPPEAFVETLRAQKVNPLSVGRVIVATREPHQREVLEAIRALGLGLQVIFNKGAVMVLPSGRLTIVAVGPFATRGAASAASERLRASGFETAVVAR